MNTNREGMWLQTFTGRQFWPADPRPDEITIEDIAHSLAHQCRFGGHCEKWYSVAQHSLLVSYECDAADALQGLLHDAAEAYVIDVPRPLKLMLGSEYAVLERDVHAAICARFGLAVALPVSVTHADEVLLATEARDLMKPPPAPWARMPAPRAERITECWDPLGAEARFLDRFRELST